MKRGKNACGTDEQHCRSCTPGAVECVLAIETCRYCIANVGRSVGKEMKDSHFLNINNAVCVHMCVATLPLACSVTPQQHPSAGALAVAMTKLTARGMCWQTPGCIQAQLVL